MATSQIDLAITSGNNTDYQGKVEAEDFMKFAYHSFDVSGAGSAVIEVDLGQGLKSVATLASGSDAVYFYPGATKFNIEASGGDIDVTCYSFGDIV